MLIVDNVKYAVYRVRAFWDNALCVFFVLSPIGVLFMLLCYRWTDVSAFFPKEHMSFNEYLKHKEINKED